MLQSIYTHAGCNYGCLYTYSPRHCFNPHTHAGCDNVHNVSGASFPVSIHTPTQGVTFLYICNVFRICFNPHTHAGCDSGRRAMRDAGSGFNPHTHAGCDSAPLQFSIATSRFNPHTHAGCDLLLPVLGLTNLCFNPHTHAGCDLPLMYCKVLHSVSIHTPTQGVTSYPM